MPRIAFVGAGSVEFTKNLLGDILSFPELADAEIALHDINQERLEVGEAMARYTAKALGASPRIEAHLDRRRALDGADHVINMIQVGGHTATKLDFEIPARYGLPQTIADTLGVGGIFRALRTIPVMLGIGSDMARAVPRRVAPELHQPDGDALLGDVRGQPDQSRSSGSATRCSTRPTSWPSWWAFRSTRCRSWAPASTTRRSSSGSSATARTSTRASTRRSSVTPSFAAGCGSRCTAGSATSRPSRASTPPSTCRGSCTTRPRSSSSGSRSASTFAAARRTWPSTSR